MLYNLPPLRQSSPVKNCTAHPAWFSSIPLDLYASENMIDIYLTQRLDKIYLYHKNILCFA